MATEDRSSNAAPDDPAHPATHPGQDSGQDKGLADRLDRDPSCSSAKLDVELDQSMDASDPPSQTQPGSIERAPVPPEDDVPENKRKK